MKKTMVFCLMGLLAAASAPDLRSEVTVTMTVVNPSSGQSVAGPLSYRGPCPVTIKFAGRVGSSESGQIQYRFVRSDRAITPIAAITVEAGRPQVVETTWTLSGNVAGWMEVEILYPRSLKSNRVEFKVECAAGQISAPALKTRPVVGAAPSRPSGKAIPKTQPESGGRPSGKAVAKTAAPDPHKATFFVANDQSGKVTMFDRTGARIGTIGARYTNGDGFGVGDVNGDGADEIVVAGDVHGRVNIYKLSGEKINAFDGQFTKRDGLAVGDVNGDRLDEIIIAGDKDGVIDVFTWTGQKVRSFQGRFTKNDAIAAGDVNGDGVDEILLHGDRHGRVNAFDFQGGKVLTFDSKLSSNYDEPRDSGLGAGDVNGDRLPEIIVAFETGAWAGHTDFDTRMIYVFDNSGRFLSRLHGEFTMGDTLAVGDVFGDGAAEIVKAGDKYHSVTVFDSAGRQLMTFIAGYTKNDGFAIARH